jgi:hypothetical protein
MFFGMVKETVDFSGALLDFYNDTRGKEMHTISRPSLHATAQRASLCTYTRRLEPHITTWVPRIDVGTVGHLGHVKLDRAEVRNTSLGDKAEFRTGFNSGGVGSSAVLEAAHIR